MDTYKVIGIMSGTSMDGVDIAYCQFKKDGRGWRHQIIAAECLPYPPLWQARLKNLTAQSALTYLKTHTFYGHYLGGLVNGFVERHGLRGKVDLVVSHGQTIFHNPQKLYTGQIGDGAAIAALTGLPVVSDLRTTDVARKGQGAPIVPIGDRHLFAGYRFCLNLGGIANISCQLPNGRMAAYDICVANLLLNKLVEPLQMEFDRNGSLAAKGSPQPDLLEALGKLPYYQKPYPKSLDASFLQLSLMPLFQGCGHMKVEDLLCTYVEHITQQIAHDIGRIYEAEGIENSGCDRLLATGGGAFNAYLMERIAAHAPVEVVMPDADTVKFKEALVMAFIGVLRLRKEANCLSSVTGANHDSVGGALWLG